MNDETNRYFYHMKYILYTICISFVCATSSSFSQTVAFQENFDAGIPPTFTLYNNDGLTPNASVSEYTSAWIEKTDPTDVTNKVASATSYFEPIGRADRWLVTPAIALGAFGNTLSWVGKSHDASYSDSYYVLLSYTNTDVENFTDTLATVFFEDVLWKNHSVNLSELGYDNQTVHIAFVLRSFDGMKLYLDSLQVEKDNPVGIQSTSVANFTIFPNPVTDKINFHSETPIQKAIIRDLNGVAVAESTNESVDISQLASGIYFIELVHSNGILSKRFVKL